MIKIDNMYIADSDILRIHGVVLMANKESKDVDIEIATYIYFLIELKIGRTLKIGKSIGHLELIKKKDALTKLKSNRKKLVSLMDGRVYINL